MVRIVKRRVETYLIQYIIDYKYGFVNHLLIIFYYNPIFVYSLFFK